MDLREKHRVHTIETGDISEEQASACQMEMERFTFL